MCEESDTSAGREAGLYVECTFVDDGGVGGGIRCFTMLQKLDSFFQGNIKHQKF